MFSKVTLVVLVIAVAMACAFPFGQQDIQENGKNQVVLLTNKSVFLWQCNSKAFSKEEGGRN